MAKVEKCPCEHPLLCHCKRNGTILCKISDFDLVDSTSDKADKKWVAKLNPSPGGSRGMIAPEVHMRFGVACS